MPKYFVKPYPAPAADHPVPGSPAQEPKGDSFDPIDWFPLQDFKGMTLEQALAADKLMAELKNCLSETDTQAKDWRDDIRHYRRAIWRRERAIRYLNMQLQVAEKRIRELDQQALALKHSMEYRKQTLRLVVEGEIDPDKLQPKHLP